MAFCICAVCIIAILRQYRPEFAVAVSVIAACIMLIFGLSSASKVIEVIREIADRSGIDEQNITLMLKAVGVCYLTQTAKDICIDCSQSVLADRVDFIGKITIIVMSLPIMVQLLSIISQIIG